MLAPMACYTDWLEHLLTPFFDFMISGAPKTCVCERMLAPEIRYRRLLAVVTRLQPASLAERSQPGSIPRACGFPLSLRSLKIEMEVKESSDKKGGSARLYKSLISEPMEPLLHSSVDEATLDTILFLGCYCCRLFDQSIETKARPCLLCMRDLFSLKKR